jgi:alkylation response protein AidB-like acyl-CoA dehydrogenase
MDLTFNEAELAFRDEFRAWLAEHVPELGPTAVGEAEGYSMRIAFQRQLAEGGWAAVHWPPEYGGRGATLTQSAIFYEELARSEAPMPANALGILLAGPTIMAWGTPAQRERYLTPILTAEEIWCQGFSEPDAGSDFASLKTARCVTTTTGSSPGRRCGPARPSTRSGACSSRGPTPKWPSTKG